MTQINHAVRRETASSFDGRNPIVELHPGYLTIRRKGTRQRFAINYGQIYWQAVKAAAEVIRQERLQRRRKRR